MLDSLPVPLQAVFWPLLGAALILALSWVLPNWLRRLVALAAAVASLTVLWSLRSAGAGRVELSWQPLNLFRMNPTLHPDSLSLLVGLLLAGITAATVLGIRGSEPKKTLWHGLVLLALAGCLVMTMAANLLALALGSALVDLALIAMAVSAAGGANRIAWRMAVPGTASTIMLVLGALQMDTQVGTASLLAQDIPIRTLQILGLAGILRLMIYPLHPRGLRTPESAATLLLLGGAGIYLLARAQAIAPILADQPWMLVLGGTALLAGGILAWTGAGGTASRPMPSPQLGVDAGATEGPDQDEGSPASDLAVAWSGFAVHQAGYAFVFVLLVRESVPWPLLSMILALGMLVIWWNSPVETAALPRARGLQWFVQQIDPWWARARSGAVERFPALGRGREVRLSRYAMALLPAIALASLAGVPLTVGAMGRWTLYATLLHKGQASLLIIALLADTLLSAGLWTGIGTVLKDTDSHRPNLTSLLVMTALAILLILFGIVPGSLNLKPVELPAVSMWGVGLLFVLPWLVGGWLARVGVRVTDYLSTAHHLVSLGWLFRTGSWAGRRLSGAVYWLGQVGEGEGWWGWALIILALAIVLLTAR